MRTSHVTPAIVLRSWSFGESDRIVSFLTEGYGKLTGLAKGAKHSRKRFANSLEPFSLVDLRFVERPHSTLVFILASELQRGFTKLATSLAKIAYASYCSEITEAFIGEREQNRLVFEHLRQALIQLEERETSVMFVTRFELTLLRLAGYQPVFNACRRCTVGCFRADGNPWYFSPQDGGMLCPSCAKMRKEILPLAPLSLEILMALQSEQQNAAVDSVIPPSIVKQIRSVVSRFVQFQLNKEIKSASFLLEFASL